MMGVSFHKAVFILLTLIIWGTGTGCGRRAERLSINPLPRLGLLPPSTDDQLLVHANPGSARIGESILIEASWGEIQTFDFEFVGVVPQGVAFLDNQSGFKSVRVTSSVEASLVTIRVRPSGQLSPSQTIEINFFSDPVVPPVSMEPILNCQLISLTGSSSQVGRSGIFQILDSNNNLPLQITNVWTQDVYEQGYFWNNLSNHTTLTFRSPGYKTVYVRARRADTMSIFNSSSNVWDCIAQFNVHVSPQWNLIAWPYPNPSPTPRPPQTEYRWVATDGGTCSRVCERENMLSSPFSDGSFCASGEVRPVGARGISYIYGTWGRGNVFTSGQSIGKYCYGSSRSKNQKQDNDRTDITVACYCRTR